MMANEWDLCTILYTNEIKNHAYHLANKVQIEHW